MNDRLNSLLDFYKKDPSDPFVIYGIALEYTSKHEYDYAEKYFKILLDTDPDYVAGYMQYAQLKVNLNQMEEAKELYKKGIIKAKEAGDNNSATEMEDFLDELE